MLTSGYFDTLMSQKYQVKKNLLFRQCKNSAKIDCSHQFLPKNPFLAMVLLSMKVRNFFFDRMILEKLFDGRLRLGKDFPKL